MRDPRPRELAFLRSLLAGPRRVNDGPVGTCVKRGWCRPMPSGPAGEPEPVLYALTEPGRDLLASACRADGSAASDGPRCAVTRDA